MRRAILLFLTGIGCWTTRAEEISVAVASNMAHCIDPLTAAFSSRDPGARIQISQAASGTLAAQIENGAPFDLFLSADAEYPERLVKKGFADGGSLRIYAHGVLVAWSTTLPLTHAQLDTLLMSDKIRRIALPNPELAPYGRAAQEYLEARKLWDKLQPRMVLGENVSQTAQFIQSGNAGIGFTAKSVVLAPKLRDLGSVVEIDPSTYAPIKQAAVLTTRGASKPGAKAFLEFLGSEAAKTILAQFGFTTPDGK